MLFSNYVQSEFRRGIKKFDEKLASRVFGFGFSTIEKYELYSNEASTSALGDTIIICFNNIQPKPTEIFFAKNIKSSTSHLAFI